jgi:hypothetical protein
MIKVILTTATRRRGPSLIATAATRPTQQQTRILPTLHYNRYYSAKMAPSGKDLYPVVDAFWHDVQAITPTSTEEAYNQFVSYFAPDAKAWLSGMGTPNTVGHAEAVEAMRGMQKYWKLKMLNVVTRTHSEDGKTIISEMSNVLEVMGVDIKGFPETEFVEFDDQGLIKTYRLYCDPSPIKQVFADLAAKNQ